MTQDSPQQSTEPQRNDPSDNGNRERHYTPVLFPEKIGQIIRIAYRLYFKNIAGLLCLSAGITAPFAVLYGLLFMVGDDIEIRTNILVLAVFSIIRNNLMESAITLILPAMICNKKTVSYSFVVYFLQETAPKIIVWSVIFCPIFFLADLIMPTLGMIVMFVLLFVVPLLTMSETPFSPRALFKDNLKLVKGNPPLAISAAFMSNLVMFVPAGVILFILIAVFISPEDLEAMLAFTQTANVNDLNELFLGGNGGYTGLFLLNVTEIIVLPIKFLVFALISMLLMKSILPQTLNRFFNRFNINIHNIPQKDRDAQS